MAKETKTKRTGDGSKAVTAAAEVHRKYQAPEALEAELAAYFKSVDAAGGIATEQGLANYLGVSVHSLRNWYDGERCEDLKEPTRKAYAQMADRFQQLILRGEKNLVSFAIFMLKQPRFGGYRDRDDTKPETKINISFGANMDEKDFK